MLRSRLALGSLLAASSLLAVAAFRAPEPGLAASGEPAVQPVTAHAKQPEQDALQSIARGRQTFRHDTFGDEAFWGDTLRLHEAIAGAANGGVGPGLSPRAALSLGLKVDVERLPGSLRSQLAAGQVDLDDRGLIVTDMGLQTSMPGVFAAGDVRSGSTKQLASAVGEGAAAAIGIRMYLEAQDAKPMHVM